jgi:SAM-dependent methyltransferase
MQNCESVQPDRSRHQPSQSAAGNAVAGGAPCPLCGSQASWSVGRIYHPQPTFVAGVPLSLPSASYDLMGCSACGFRFKHPQIPQSLLLECYRKADKGNWEERVDPVQRRFDLLKTLLERHSRGRRILDIGCFNGALLEYLGPQWQRHGVEPSMDAADLARERGVKVLGATLEDLPDNAGPFDAVTAIDVAEHIAHPLPFFRRVQRMLAPGGVALFVTGDFQSSGWRLQGSRYWYCSLPEHVSFYARPVMEHIGRETGLGIVEYRRLCHGRYGKRKALGELVKNTGYRIGVSLRGLGLKRLRQVFVERRGPVWMTARDHMFVVMRRLD